MFCGVSDYFVTNLVQMGRTGPINAEVLETKSHQNFSQRTHPIHPIRPQTHVLRRFRPFHYCTNFGAKHAKMVPLMHKFVERSRVKIFRNEHTRSTLLDPKLLFWGVLDHFVTARTLVQNGSNWGNYCTSLWNEDALKFFATNAPDPPHWTPNSSFWAIQIVLLLHELRCKIG
jgi:hypothetical protein